MSDDGPLMGVSEIAERLGVSKPRASAIVRRDGFPKPYDVLAMGAVWRRTAVERWVRKNRKP